MIERRAHVIAISALVAGAELLSSAPAVGAASTDETARILYATAATKKLRAMSFDPASFVLNTLIEPAPDTLCFAYRAKNRFGALVPGYAVLEGGKMLTSSDNSGAFERSWKKHCDSKPGADRTRVVSRNL